MFSLKSTIRDKKEDPAKLRQNGFVPAILYGEGIKNQMLKVAEKDFIAAFKSAGESSMMKLKVKNEKLKTESEYDVLIHQTEKNPLSGRVIHADFYHPSSRKKVVAEIPLVFQGEAPAVKTFSAILVKEAHSIEVKGLAQNLPREVIVDLGRLATLEDRILVKDLGLSDKLECKKGADEIIALVVLPKEEKPEPVPVASQTSPTEESKESQPAAQTTEKK